MPTATRRRVLAHDDDGSLNGGIMSDENDIIQQEEVTDLDDDEDFEEGEDDEDEDEEDEEDEEEVEEAQGVEIEDASQPPPGLKEISSLASWTVSTAKPGSGVAALRHSSTAHFWQSDGPQPHLLSIHFFKLVSIVHMRIFLDFNNDESYTPTKIQFLAGMGVHDVQQFAEMSFEQPNGWIDVDFSNVGPVDGSDNDSAQQHGSGEVDWSKRPILRAFLVQVRILENHQNGKDTHLRGVQIFAQDETRTARTHEQPATAGAKPSKALPLRGKPKVNTMRKESNNIKQASWMLDPELR